MQFERERPHFSHTPRTEPRHRYSLLQSARCISRISLAVLALQSGIGIKPPEPVSTAKAAPLAGRTIPKKGDLVFLSKGIEIREGPGKRFKFTVTVPVDNWVVKVIGNKEVCADDWIWIDTSRKDAGDPSGGTGWAALFTPCEEPPPPPTPTHLPPQPSPRPPESTPKPTPIAQGTLHETKPEKGKLFYLKKGTQLREGPGFQYRLTIGPKWNYAVPQDNWAVMARNVPNSPQCANGWRFDDFSRQEAGDPAGGSGWAATSLCEAITPIPLPTPTIGQPLPELPKKPTPIANGTVHNSKPVKGELYGLKKGTQLREGPGFSSKLTIGSEWDYAVPNDNWLVRVKQSNPVCVDGWWWYDFSRKEAGDPSGGSGWAAVTPCETKLATLQPETQPGSPDPEPQPLRPASSPRPTAVPSITGKPAETKPSMSSGSRDQTQPAVIEGSTIEQKYRGVPFIGSVTVGERSADRSPYETTGTVANFAGGFIHSSKYGTYETHGDIANVYLSERGSSGWLGFPTNGIFLKCFSQAWR